MNLVTELEAAKAQVAHLTRLWSVACFYPNIAAAIEADEVLNYEACVVEAEQAAADPLRVDRFRRNPTIDQLKDIWK